jgi:hypothetical protein
MVAAVVSVGNNGLTCSAKDQNELAGAPEYSLNRVQLTSTTAIQSVVSLSESRRTLRVYDRSASSAKKVTDSERRPAQ